jgi:hypothetical protein
MQTIDPMRLLVIRVVASRPSMPRGDGEHLLQSLASEAAARVAVLQPGGQVPGVAQSLLGVGVANALTSLASTHSFSCGRHHNR